MRLLGLLLDYGGTLVQETGVDLRAGHEWMLAHASHRPEHVTVQHVFERASRVTREISARREETLVETPWPTLTRLIHDYLGIRFTLPMDELEIGFWRASVQTEAMAGARHALEWLHLAKIPVAVVSNSSFGERVIRYELAKHGLADHLAFVMASADYSIRKPHVMLFETAAARLGIDPVDVWFMGDRLDTDVVGAKAAGMTAVWFNPNGDNPATQPDLMVASWNDLIREISEANTGLSSDNQPPEHGRGMP